MFYDKIRQKKQTNTIENEKKICVLCIYIDNFKSEFTFDDFNYFLHFISNFDFNF